MKYFSLFSGIGGFEFGIGEEHECVGFSEIDKYATQVYKHHFPNHKNYGDITKIITSEIQDFELLVGGFPCQSFSIAGKRGGFHDTRGTLFFEIARILADKRPRYLVLENVKGLLSHDQGKTFQTILRVLSDLGYGVQWQVLNSKNFGVPQNRERVFIVGHLRGTSRPKVFPITRGNKSHIKEITSNLSDAQRVYDINGIAKTQKALGGGQGAKTGLYAIRRGRSTDPWKKSNIAPTVRNGDKADVRAVITPDRLNKRQNGRRMKDIGEPAFTVTAQDRHGVLINKTIRTGGRGSLTKKHNWDTHLIDGQIRRLTPKECERLQGFPDDWTSEGTEGNISDTQRYKMAGNAVSVPVIKAIVEKLIV